MGTVTFSCVFVVLAFLLANGNGVEVGFYELKRGDFSVKLTNYGAVINSVILPDRNGVQLFFPLSLFWLYNLYDFVLLCTIFFFFTLLSKPMLFWFILSGKLDDVVLGFDSVDGYKVGLIQLPLFPSAINLLVENSNRMKLLLAMIDFIILIPKLFKYI